MDTIAFLGAGLIGSGMVRAARARGLDVVVWNRTAAKADALAEVGARPAPTIEAAVRGAARVHVVLSDDAAVDAVLAAATPALAAGALVIDHSTASPRGTLTRATRAADAGVAFFHAPVFMSPPMAAAAKGLIVCSGPETIYERAREALAAMTGDVWYLGARPDLAACYKLFGNAMILTIVGGLADVFAIAKAQGVPPEVAHQLFARFKPAATIDARGAKMAVGDYAPSFELAMAQKDVRLMLDAAGDVPLAVLPALSARMAALIAAGDGGADVAVLARDAVPPRAG